MTDTPTDTWPDPNAPGVPANLAHDGAHVLQDDGGAQITLLWNNPWWMNGRGVSFKPHEIVARGWRYLGPMLTPPEVAAREAAAKADGMREAAGIARAAEIPIGEGPRSAIAAAIIAAIGETKP